MQKKCLPYGKTPGRAVSYTAPRIAGMGGNGVGGTTTTKERRFLASPSTLTPRQRSNARYRVKMRVRRAVDEIVLVLESDARGDLGPYVAGQLARIRLALPERDGGGGGGAGGAGGPDAGGAGDAGPGSGPARAAR